MKPIRCPRCLRPLESCGEVADPAGVVMPVYQCEQCVVPWDIDGQRFEASFTLAVTPDGDLLDAEKLERLS